MKWGLVMVLCIYGVFIFGNIVIVSIFGDGFIVVEVGGVEMG